MADGAFALYDRLPIGVLVAQGGRIVYVNAALLELFRLDVSTLLDHSVGDIIDTLVSPEQRGYVRELSKLLASGALPGPEGWVQIAGPGNGRAVHVSSCPGPSTGQLVVLVRDAGQEAANHQLTEGMVLAANDLVRCRDEQEVLEAAVDAVHRQGFWSSFLLFEGERLRLGALRLPPELVKRSAEVLGVPAQEHSWRAETMPHLERMFATRRAVFFDDNREIVNRALPEVAEVMRELMPSSRMVDIPIVVDGRRFGVASVTGNSLSRANIPTLELFGQLISGALENVRHLRAAEARLQEVTALQQELVSRERLAALGEAAGVLSHEARNPLGAILNALAVLRRSRSVPESDLAVLDIAEEEAFRLDALVRDLMELARPLEARPRPLKLDQVVDAAISDLKRRLGRTAPSFHLALSPDLPQVHGDPMLLRTAVENLLRNAAQVVGGAAVRVDAREAGGVVVFGVDDALPSSPSGAAQSEAFDPFSIVRPRGTGLGLAVVKRVIEAQGAQVRARNGGARIELLLPIAQGD